MVQRESWVIEGEAWEVIDGMWEAAERLSKDLVPDKREAPDLRLVNGFNRECSGNGEKVGGGGRSLSSQGERMGKLKASWGGGFRELGI